jgi:hypothetical protein
MGRIVVDVDDISTWPAHVSEYVDHWANRLRGTTEYTCSLEIPLEQESKFCRMLDGYLVRAYHCTRLLDHECESILKHGLRVLSVDLMVDRIRAACDVGAITDAEYERYLASHALAVSCDKHGVANRINRVCLIFSRTVLDHSATGVKDLLDTWGGEALYSYLPGGGRRSGDRERLQEIGHASIVVAHLDVAARIDLHRPKCDFITPGLDRCFVGAALGLAHR